MKAVWTGLYVVGNKFINTMSQVPTITQLLPLPASEDADLKRKSGITCMSPIRKRCWIPSCAATSNLRFIRAWLKTGQRAGRPYGGDESRDR